MATYFSILAGKFHGQRSLVGYSPSFFFFFFNRSHNYMNDGIQGFLLSLFVPLLCVLAKLYFTSWKTLYISFSLF